MLQGEGLVWQGLRQLVVGQQADMAQYTQRAQALIRQQECQVQELHKAIQDLAPMHLTPI